MSSDTPSGSRPAGGVGDADAAGVAGSGPVAPVDPAAPVEPTTEATAPVDPAAPAPATGGTAPATPAVAPTTSTPVAAPAAGATALPAPVDEPKPREPTDPAELLAVDLLALPGVAALHGGLFGEVATYLPGRRVTGVRLGEGRTDVHLSVEWGSSVHDVVEAVRRTTEERVGGPVDVYVEDVAAPRTA